MSVQKKYDPLLEALALFAKLYYRPVSIESLISGLPVQPNTSSPEMFSMNNSKGMFSRVAKRAGFVSKLIKSDLMGISELLLPCIIILKDKKACILDSVDKKKGKAKIVLPEIGESEQWVSLDKLEEMYLGFAFLLKKEYRYKNRPLQLIEKDQGHWFFGTLWRSKEIYYSVIMASLMINLFVLATPMFTMNVYDRVVPNNAIDTLWVLAVGIGLAYMFDTVLKFIRTYFLEIAGKKSDVIMSSIIFEQTMNLRMEEWPTSIGAFANILREFETIRNFFTASTMVALIDLPFAVLFLFVIFYIAGPLVIVPLFVILLLVLFSFSLVKPLRESIESTSEASSNKNALLIENLHNITTIKTLGSTHHAQWEWEEATGEIANKSLRSRLLSNSITVVTGLLVQLTTIGIIVFGIYLINDLQLSLGGLIATTILSGRTIGPMAQVAGLITSYQQTKNAYNHLDELMHKGVERPAGKQFVRRPEFKGSIMFQNLGFTYPGSEKETLTGVNLRIKQGEHVGIIGRVGSGKSTLVKLLVGLYRPTEGSLSFDDIDISQIDPADLRRQVAFQSQEVELLRGTIRENILYKEPHIDDEALLNAAYVGGVDLFVNRMPMGFDTPLNEQGVGLSGGQRQAVSIARTALLDAPILILDEPTNSMDNTTETEIRKRLFEYTRDRTLILVTHKAQLLDLVERLIVVEDGRILIDGPKEKVLKALQSGQVGVG